MSVASSVDVLDRVRALCLALPDAHEVEAWGEPTFRVRNKLFAMYASPGNHHGRGRPALWIKAKAENQRLLMELEPTRYFAPPYVGPSGWVGMWLDKRPRWREVEELLRDGYRQVAPKRLLQAHGL
ncbi:MAG: MmcQ/YjbR family DNA-binding protein [Gemmatimonadaceae bacterium]|nr:MmcQ/YjbR family DNA-binding protein [Gemmatimonadaceae bacterium]